MTREEMGKIMEESDGRRIRFTMPDEVTLTGYVDVAEIAYDNDEGEGASVCVIVDDGGNLLLYESDVIDMKILD